MGVESGIEDFAKKYQQEIISQSQVEDEEFFREDKFTEIMMEDLYEADETDNPSVCYHRTRGIKVNGYSVSDNESCLDLFVSIYYGEGTLSNVSKTDINTAFKRVYTFFTKSLDGYYKYLEEASHVFDLASIIYDLKDNLTNVRLFLLTDGISKKDSLIDEQMEDIIISYHIWDLERLYRLKSSGNKREAIEIDFEDYFGMGIPCLPMVGSNPDYTTYLAIITGDMLFELYDQFGPRLLERNVRSFLQVRGNVNKGIRKTILDEPHMFLAYNNGISATAQDVIIKRSLSGEYEIKRVKEFQIVNGGQTTASIYSAVRKNKADVSEVSVPVKLTVLKDADHVDFVVPKISEYANSQNKVSAADFTSNHPFHVVLEELSRTIWAPAQHGMQAQTHWYYERARGQYLDEKGREGTVARKKAFEAINPNRQKFVKTDLAKFENTWSQVPHIVSRGAQKNFKEFMARLKERGDFKPDRLYYEHLIAKAILFKQAEKLVQKQNYGGYRANIVTYTLSLMFHKTGQRINLDQIWKEQSISPILVDTIVKVSADVHIHITNPPDGKNITEWCKKEQCWKDLLNKNIDLPAELTRELIDTSRKTRGSADNHDYKDRKIIREIMIVSDETWFNLSHWAKETGNLQSWQRKIAHSMGNLVTRKKEPSIKQSIQAHIIIEEAHRLGFKFKDETKLKAEEERILNKLTSEDKTRYMNLPEGIKIEYLRNYIRHEKIEEYNWNKSKKYKSF